MPDRGSKPGASRRDALKKMATGAGSLVTLPILGQISVTPAMAQAADRHQSALAAGPDADWKPLFFDSHQNETVIALTELIIPATDTPGAKAALVNRLIDLWLNDEDADKQKEFFEGLSWLDGRCLAQHGKPFVELTEDQQTALLTALADPENKKPEDQPGVRFFEQMKDMTIFGYYTSQIGLDQELQYQGDAYHNDFPGACKHPEHQT
jgi:glucoside 3-dehydrogenase (cytochrome c) hitch-hiker subunit